MRHVRHVSAPDGDGGSARNRRTSLELRLFRPLPVEVAGAIDRVRNEKLPTKTYLGGIRVTSRVTSLDEAAFENYLTDLARSGQEIAAVSAARQRLDLPLVEARDLVQRLTGGP